MEVMKFIIVQFGTKLKILMYSVLGILALYSCKNNYSNNESTQHKTDSLAILKTNPKIITPDTNNKQVDKILSNPFDLEKFKKAKGVGQDGGGMKWYYYKPNQKGMYTGFFCFGLGREKGYIGEKPDTNIDATCGLTITTFRPYGKYFNDFINPTETLIAVDASFNYVALPEIAFIGIDTVKIKKKLGSNFIRKDSCFIYSKDSNALTLKINHGKIEWLKYTRLNFNLTKDNIPKGLLKWMPSKEAY
jgi:hypothetical protein